VVDEAASDGEEEVWRDGDAGGETKLRRVGRRSGGTGTPEGGLTRGEKGSAAISVTSKQGDVLRGGGRLAHPSSDDSAAEAEAEHTPRPRADLR
jgi:hypothetical protein